MLGDSRLDLTNPTERGNNLDSQASTDRFLAAVGMAEGRTKQPWRRQDGRSSGDARPQSSQPAGNSAAPVSKASTPIVVPKQLIKREPGHFDSPKVAIPRPPLPTEASSGREAVHRTPHSKSYSAIAPGPERSTKPQRRQQNNLPTTCNPNIDRSSTRAEILSLDSAPLRSPDLEAYRPPGRARNDEDSPAPSLASVSSFHIEGDEARAETSLPSDVRNNIGLQRSLKIEGNTWETNKFSDGQFAQHSFLQPFIASWRRNIPCNVCVANPAQEIKCDIDTTTGQFIEPVSYPDTMPILGAKGELDWRRQTWSSVLLARRRIAVRERNGIVESYEGLATPEEKKAAAEAQRKALEMFANRPAYCTFSPRTLCYLRPVQPKDMEEIVEIYNWEVENGFQALDSEPLSVSDFSDIVSRTQKLGMPFLVAVYGSAKKLNLGKGSAFYTSVTPHPDAAVALDPKKLGMILGFGFLSIWEPGLTGSGLGSSRATAKVNVYVHPSCRRKRIGFSLLDKLLSTVSDRYTPTEGYDFVDPSNSPTYKTARDNSRKFYQVFTTFLVRHKFYDDGNPQLKALQAGYGDELKYIQKMLTDDFGFDEHGRFQMVHRTPKTRPGPVVWLDSVVFDTQCWLGIDYKNDLVDGEKY
ncbi:hypothetical protein B0T16DRAFT_148073 [Cercophora newfieldiana]|uniref:N-acetyltransferase domain-containing protein n=1 Tax=Cercophora newfieldiana TaxID=92897 RepID=A0AA39Y4M3_9PEZI|nr:hypothetical protein B0T16DRAFT_148073 [Cercophora newfieldiana]